MALPMLKGLMDHADDDLMRLLLLRAIELARQEAHAHGMSTVLCKSNDHLTCSRGAKDSLMVFLNENEDGIVHAKENILAIMQTSSQRGSLNWRSFPGYRDYLIFSAIEITNTDNGTFWYCHTSGLCPAWAITLNKTGRARVVYPNKGEIKDSHGQSLRCS